MEPIFCQSCAMPMADETQHGTNADGSKSADYCTYCYQNGAFTAQCTMEAMIDFCAGPMSESNPAMSKAQAVAAMQEFFPSLKRWR